MKNIILVYTFIFGHLFVFGQDVKSNTFIKTKIYIIGVVHSENEDRNSDSLLNILRDLKPDLILSEHDTLSGYFKSDYRLVQPPKWYKAARKLNVGRKMPPEMDLLYKYQESNNSVLIYPFDIAIVNRKKYGANQQDKENLWIASLNSASKNNKMTDSILSYHKKYISYNNWFFEISQAGYFLMNRTIVTDSIRQMMKFEEEYFPKLFESVPTLSEYKEWHTENTKYWMVRNEVMAKNIIRFTKMTKAKKVVVFTGLLHKYILKDLLNSYNSEEKYEVVEYFER